MWHSSQSLMHGLESRAYAKGMRPPVPGVSHNQLIEDIPGSQVQETRPDAWHLMIINIAQLRVWVQRAAE